MLNQEEDYGKQYLVFGITLFKSSFQSPGHQSTFLVTNYWHLPVK